MIKINDIIIKQQPNFWNHCLFHPTDAIEDPWGKRILDKMAEDGAVKTIRIYTMFEDIVYLDERGEIQYDFRLSDLRLDYMLEKGYDILLAYAGIPDCIASSTANTTVMSKNKTRYKGKLWNSAPPKDYADWEEICYQYTKHNAERYGIDMVSKWYCQCFNEADHTFFMSELSREEGKDIRVKAFCELYAAFVKGIHRVSEKIQVGGPNFAFNSLDNFLDYVKNNNLRLDFISLHNYGTYPEALNAKTRMIAVSNNINKHRSYLDTIRKHGFGDTKIIIDEWGASSNGFCNCEDAPALIFRETEVFSAYYAKLIYEFINSEYDIEKMLICLSGQHEMVQDFTGFRNFFTLNFIRKPIYNAYVLASKLGENLVTAETDQEHVFVIPTKNSKGDYAILVSYSDEYFSEDLPETCQTVEFSEKISDKTVTVWCIDKENTNPYRLYQKMGASDLTENDLKLLREEGNLKSLPVQSGNEKLTLKMTANSVFLITVNG